MVNIADMGQISLVNWVVGGVGSSPNFGLGDPFLD